ncbi:hypothetical protein L9F63_020121, partial [Diploptera punctata]
ARSITTSPPRPTCPRNPNLPLLVGIRVRCGALLWTAYRSLVMCRITGTVDWGDSESRRCRFKAGEEAAELGSVGGGGGSGGDRLPPPNVFSRILFVVTQSNFFSLTTLSFLMLKFGPRVKWPSINRIGGFFKTGLNLMCRGAGLLHQPPTLEDQ